VSRPVSVVCVGFTAVDATTVVRNLGVMFDAALSAREHVSRVAQVCLFHLRRLRPMRARLGRDVTLALVTALVISRLDYCNCVLAELPATTVLRVLHAAARLINGLRAHDHVTSALKVLQWLPIEQRVDYKLCLLVHKVTVRQAPSYFTCMLTAVTEVPSLSTLKRQLRHSQDASEIRQEGVFCCRPSPRAWNRLPTELKLMRSTPVFKRSLETFLF